MKLYRPYQYKCSPVYRREEAFIQIIKKGILITLEEIHGHDLFPQKLNEVFQELW